MAIKLSTSIQITQAGHDLTDQTSYFGLTSGVPTGSFWIIQKISVGGNYSTGTGATYVVGKSPTTSGFSNLLLGRSDFPLGNLQTDNVSVGVSNNFFQSTDYIYVVTNMSDGNKVDITVEGILVPENHPFISFNNTNAINATQTLTTGNYLLINTPSGKALNIKNIFVKAVDETGVVGVSLFKESNGIKYLIETIILTGNGAYFVNPCLLPDGDLLYLTTMNATPLDVYYNWTGVEVT